MSKCKDCDAELSSDDVGLTKLLVNRGSTTFLCKKCLMKKYRLTEKYVDELIEYKKKHGCSLFS